jgi:hypothetical protein
MAVEKIHICDSCEAIQIGGYLPDLWFLMTLRRGDRYTEFHICENCFLKNIKEQFKIGKKYDL